MSIARPLPDGPSIPFESAAGEAWLQVSGLSKSYGSVKALSDVSIDFRPGEVHAIVGENGAGKSTLTKIIAGEETPDAGAILIEGREVTLSRPAEARRAGIAVVHQQFQLVEQLTAAENICMESVPVRRVLGFPFRDDGAMLRRAAERLAPFQLQHKAGALVRDLSVAEKQVIEISRALGSVARLLILDEPTSALSQAETETLFRNVRGLRDQGVAILFIAHNLSEVLSIADRITVLRDGRLITTVPAGALDAAELARLIVGREIAAMQERAPAPAGDMLLGVTAPHEAGGDIVALRRGEIIGMPTYIGSALRGFLARISGEHGSGGLGIALRGDDISGSGVARRVRAGLCFVPGDATAEGLAPKLTVEENILLPNVARFTRFGLLRRRAAREAAADVIRDLDIRPANPKARIEHLSGGNRQKVAIAKWLLSGADVLVMDDPTRGVDVGAKVELYRIMRGHVEKRGGILFASSDLEELIGLSDRLVVIRGEKVVARFDERPFRKSEILAASAGRREAASNEGMV